MINRKKPISPLRFVSTLLSIILVGSSLTYAQTAQAPSETIKLGLIVSETGPLEIYGGMVRDGADLAIDEINASGGILGKKVELITCNDQGSVKESIKAFNKLTDKDQVTGIIGPMISSTSLAVAPLAEKKKMPMISPTATHPDVTKDYPYVFRAGYLDKDQGTVMAQFAANNLKAKTAAILYNKEDDFSAVLAVAFKLAFEKAGGKVVHYESYTSEKKDFKKSLNTIKTKKPAVLFNPDYYGKSGEIATQVKAINFKTIMLGGDGWDPIEKDFAKVTEGYYYLTPFIPNDPDPIVQAFVTAYQDKYDGNTPNSLNVLSYEATKIMLQAIEKAESLESEKIQKALQQTHITTVTGLITFDKNGDPQKSFSIGKIEKGVHKLNAKVRKK